MDIVLNRRAGVAVRDQLRFQLELKILTGDLSPGQRLPSVRALARRFKLHPNTVSAAYRDLEATGHVTLKSGAGVFVCPGAPSAPQDARTLDEMIRLSLYMAFRRGFTGAEIRAAVERWLAAAPPERVMVVDPAREMAELLVFEIREALHIPAGSCSVEELRADPRLLAGALAVTLPYHLETVARLAPSAAVESVTLEVPEEDRKLVQQLAAGSIVLLVTHSPTVVPFAEVLLKSLRGDEIHCEARSVAESREWRRLLPAADLVVVDGLASRTVALARPRRMREIRLVPKPALERVRDALTVVVTPNTGSDAAGGG